MQSCMWIFPCNECAKVLIQAGNRDVVYLKDKLRVRSWCIGCTVIVMIAVVYYMDRLNRVVLVTCSLSGTRKI